MIKNQDRSGTVLGIVKWFEPSKGFGFVTSDAYEDDILLHVNTLRAFGTHSVCNRARLRISVCQTVCGLQAQEIHGLWPPDEIDNLASNNTILSPDMTIPLQPARVKWFDENKGFGFVTIFGRSEDVFFHKEILRRSGMRGLQTGDAVSVRAVQGDRGWIAVSIEPWGARISCRA